MKKEKETKVVEQTQYPHEALKRVEDTRLVFWKSYKLHNTFKLVVMMICAFILFQLLEMEMTNQLLSHVSM